LFLLLTVGVASFTGCAFTAHDAIELGHAENARDASDNLKRLNDYMASQGSRPNDRVAIVHAWQSAARIASEHRLSSTASVEYARLLERLMASESDAELRGWKYAALGVLRDEAALPVLMREVSGPLPDSPEEWECLLQALHALSNIVNEVDLDSESTTELTLGLTRLRAHSASRNHEQRASPRGELDLAIAAFDVHLKRPRVIASALRSILSSETTRESANLQLALLEQANDVLAYAKSDRSGEWTGEELGTLTEQLGALVLDSHEVGALAWKILRTHAPMHGAMALCTFTGGTKAADMPWDRVADAVSELPRASRVWVQDPMPEQTWLSDSRGTWLNPNVTGQGAEAAGLYQHLLALARRGLEEAVGRPEWSSIVATLHSLDVELVATELTNVPLAAFRPEVATMRERPASLYVRVLGKLITPVHAISAPWRAAVESRLLDCLALHDDRVPGLVVAALGPARSGDCVVRLSILLDQTDSESPAPTNSITEGRIQAYLSALSELDKIGATETLTVNGHEFTEHHHYRLLAPHLSLVSKRTQLVVLEFLRLRSPEMCVTVILDAMEAAPTVSMQGSSPILAGLSVVALHVKDDAVIERMVPVLAGIAKSQDEDAGLLAVGVLSGCKHAKAHAAIIELASKLETLKPAVQVVVKAAATDRGGK